MTFLSFTLSHDLIANISQHIFYILLFHFRSHFLAALNYTLMQFKNIIISQMHTKLHTDVKNVKHYYLVSFACLECIGVYRSLSLIHVCAQMHCTYHMYAQLITVIELN